MDVIAQFEAETEAHVAFLPYYPLMLGAGLRPDPEHLAEVEREWVRESGEYMAWFRRGRGP